METNAYKQIAVDYLNLCAKGDSRKAFHNYVGEGFIHHNVFFKAGAETLMLAMEEDARQTPGKLFEVKRALQDGDLVAVHSWVRANEEDTGFALAHILRFAGGKIVELWDLAQAVPAETINEHGMF